MYRWILAVLFVVGFAAPAWGATCEFTVAAANVPTIWTSGTQNVSTACATEAVTDDYEINTGQTVIVRGDGVDLTTGSVTVNGGTLIIEPGAVLQFGDGTATTRLAGFLQVSGTTVAEGTVLRTCRVISEPTLASTSTITLTTDCDMTGVTSSHRLVFGDDDPEDPGVTLTNQGVQVGPGAPSGAFRASGDSWSNYAVSSVSANTVTYDIGSGHTFTSTGTGAPAPYAGTRTLTTYPEVLTLGGPGSTTDDGEIYRDIYGRYTSIAVNHDVWGEGSLCSVEADYGSRYLYMVEDTAGISGPDNPNDPSICAGLQAKVLSCENGGTTDTFVDADVNGATDEITLTAHPFNEGEPVTLTIGVATDSALAANDTYYVKEVDANTIQLSESPYGAAIDLASDGDANADTLTPVDRLIVAGDLTQCTAAEAHITMGARRGDKIHIVQPAVFEGERSGAAPGDGGMLFLGGTLNANWVRFQNLGAQTNDLSAGAPSGQPDVGQFFNLMFAQGGVAGATTTTSGYLKNFDIQYMEALGTSDTLVLGFGSNSVGNGATHRYPSDGVGDWTNLVVDRGHIHDCQNDDGDSSGGCHGLFNTSATVSVSRIRVERVTDDGFGALTSRGAQVAEANAGRFTARQILSFEQLAGSNNSQECFAPAILESQGVDADASADQVSMSGWMEASDIMAMGCFGASSVVTGFLANIDRLVTGGVSAGAQSPVKFQWTATATSAAFDDLTNLYGSNVRDSYLGAFGTTSTGLHDLSSAKLYGSFLFGGDIIRQDDNTVKEAAFVTESFIDNGNTSASDIIDTAANAVDGHCDTCTWTDSIFRSFEWDNGAQGNVIADGDGTTNTTAYVVRRLIHMASDSNSGSAFNGTIDTGGAGSVVDGYFFSEGEGDNGGTETDNETWDLGTAVTLTALCVETNRTTRMLEQPNGSGNDVALSANIRIGLNNKPTANEQNTLRGIVDGVASGCPSATPNYIGWRTFGIAHARLGDFVVMQNENFAYDPARPSWRIVKPVRSGDGRAAGSLTGSRAF